MGVSAGSPGPTAHPARPARPSRRVRLIDCTLREGDQAAGVWLTPEDKLHLFGLLDEAGVAIVDAGMPAISEPERRLLGTISAIEGRRTRVAASTRCLPSEIALAAGCGVDEVFLIFPVSAIHRERRLALDREGWRALGARALDAAAGHGLPVNLVLEDASRATPDELADAIAIARDGGARRVMVCDTVGVLTPAAAWRLASAVVEMAAPDMEVGTHFHDDLAMATANTIAAIEAGVTWPSVTVNGVGERAGNAVLAEVAAACERLLARPTGVHLDRMLALSREVERATGTFLSPDAPLVGSGIHLHESGIHVHGLLEDPRTYESVEPALFGQVRRVVFGKHSGRAALAAFAREHGLQADGRVIDAVLEAVKTIRPADYRQVIDGFLAARDAYLARRHGVPEEELVALFEAAARREAALR